MIGFNLTTYRRDAVRLVIIGCLVLLSASAFASPALDAPPSEVQYAYDLSKSFRYAIAQVKPAVVSIHSEQQLGRGGRADSSGGIQDFFRQLLPQGDDESERSLPRGSRRDWQGSGVIVSADGEIITNNHVIEHSDRLADRIRVTLDDDRELDALVLHTDPETDIAIIKIQGDGPFPFAKLGDSDEMAVGDWVLAIGNPFGLHQTVSQGIVSAIGRTDTQVGVAIKDYIQTTAAINLGNSGGPLINLQGEVIGLNNAIHTAPGIPANIGIGFTIPSNLVKRVITDLKEFGQVRRGYLGVILAREDQTVRLRERLGVNHGALVEDVQRGLPAERSGLRRGDLILNIDGERVRNHGDLIKMISDHLAGDTVELTVIRNGGELTFSVLLEQRPPVDELRALLAQEDSPIVRHLGLEVETLTVERAKELGFLSDVEGAVIVWVEPDGPAAEMEIQTGDVITEANMRRVKSPEDLTQALNQVVEEMTAMNENRRPLLMEVHRANSRFFPKYIAVKARQ